LQGPLDEQDKLAPEWAALLQQLRQLRPQIERAAALAAAANGSAAAAASARAVQDALPSAAEWDAERGQLLVGAVVTFPGLAGPASRRIPAASTQQAQRARRIMLERRRRDAGAAAAADWRPHLRSLGGARVRRAAADSLLVLAPAERLQQVLSWLAQRPATHWVAPAPKMQLNNIRASTITQVGPRRSPFLLCSAVPLLDLCVAEAGGMMPLQWPLPCHAMPCHPLLGPS
jgi:hypothetical protein